MARVLSLDSCPSELRNHLVRALKSTDEAVLLPAAGRNPDTGEFSNVVFRLDGTETDVDPSVFSAKWGNGVSAVKVDGARAKQLVACPVERAKALQALADAIHSETQNSDTVVGPPLECDELDRDTTEWKAGFDGPAAFVGLFFAQHSRAPEIAARGQNRVHESAYLVAKAGGGVSATTFHQRLTAALRKGKTLEQCFATDGEPGAAALRRVSNSGSRNRGRILNEAAVALGLPFLDTTPDQSSLGRYRACVTNFDVNCNTLRKVEGSATPLFQYTTGLDGGASQGLLTLSNAADGLALLLSPTGDSKFVLKNEAHNSLPFSSVRILSDRDALQRAVDAYKKAKGEEADPPHIDDAFLRKTFAWRNRKFRESQPDIEPLALWGTHESEAFLSTFSRELGVANANVVRLRPLVVALAGVDSGKLRAAVRSL